MKRRRRVTTLHNTNKEPNHSRMRRMQKEITQNKDHVQKPGPSFNETSQYQNCKTKTTRQGHVFCRGLFAHYLSWTQSCRIAQGASQNTRESFLSVLSGSAALPRGAQDFWEFLFCSCSSAYAVVDAAVFSMPAGLCTKYV